MHFIAEVIFYNNMRKHLPMKGYRPDAIFNDEKDYRGITFTELPVSSFDTPILVCIKFTFQACHYNEIQPKQKFQIMEGAHQVGEGKIISIENM